MKKYFFYLFFVITSFSASAQIKPEALVLFNFVKFEDTALRESLENFTQIELSRNFELKSKEETADANLKARDEIDSENCSEQACIKKMGELLDVEYTFNLKIIDTGQGWDLTAIRSDYFEEATVRRNELCSDCSLPKARKLISEMLSDMVTGKVSLRGGKSRLLINSTPKSSVFIDGYSQGDTPLDLSIPANKPFEILMVAEGYNDFTEELILKPGQEKKINKRLVRKRGNIRITSEPSGATIYLDGKIELDSQEKPVKTPADLFKKFGEYELKLKYERYEESTQTLVVNKRKLGTKNIILKPKPGRLIIRVPSEFKSAEVYINGESIGDMDGSIAKTFEVAANISMDVQLKQDDFESNIESIEVGPDSHKRLEFSKFSDLRLVELRRKNRERIEEERKRKEEERQDRLDNIESEKRRKEMLAKFKKKFGDNRIEVRTFGYLLSAQAFSIHFYLNPTISIGYATGKQSNLESGKAPEYSHSGNYDEATLKYSTDMSAYVARIRLSTNFYQTRKNYLEDTFGFSYFQGSGTVKDESSGFSSKINPSGYTFDYVLYWPNGYSILFGIGLISYDPEENWFKRYDHFIRETSWTWGLFNIGYMF